jgi:hypothetical protein
MIDPNQILISIVVKKIKKKLYESKIKLNKHFQIEILIQKGRIQKGRIQIRFKYWNNI